MINKLPFQRRPHRAHDNAKDVLLKVPPTPLGTPQNSGAIERLIRQTKLQVTKHNGHTVREDLLNNLIDLLAKFGISRERDQELVERTFQQWREANKLNTKVDGRHLGTKTDKLARVLDGKEIAKLYEAREKKDHAKQQRKPKPRAAKSRDSSQRPSHQSTYKRTRFQTPIPSLVDLQSDSETDNEPDVSHDESILSTITV